MIRLKVFISSVQKELRSERIATGSFLSTEDFLRDCTAPRIFEDYPSPLRPNPKAYLHLLRRCQLYLLILGEKYGSDAGDGLSATHEEYRLAQELQMPTLVCVKGKDADREKKARQFFEEIKNHGHTYSRFDDGESLLEAIGKRLREHIEQTFSIEPRRAQLEQADRNRRSAAPFEKEPLHLLSYDQLDTGLALEMMASAEDQDQDQIDPGELDRLLLSRSYLWKDGDTLRPTTAGALLLARNPGVVLPQARVQMDAFPGIDRHRDALDSEILSLPLPQVIESAVAFIRRNSAKPLIVKGLKRVNTETYPQEVLREVVVNAVAHRDYGDAGAKIGIELFADRLLVSSPGHPPGGQSLERLARGQARSRARNPLLVQGLSWFELMDERGSGIPRMVRLLEQFGHPKPIFSIDHDCLVVELRPSATDKKASPKKRSGASAVGEEHQLPPREAVLAEVRAVGTISTKVCVQRLGMASATAKRLLAGLVEEGTLTKVGAGRSTHYRLTEPF